MYRLRCIGPFIYCNFIRPAVAMNCFNISSFSRKEMKMYKKLFDAMDTDQDGKLSKEDIKEGLTYFVDYHPTNDEINGVMKILDTNMKSVVNFEEFLNVISFIKRTVLEQHIKAAFEHADSDGDGYLSKQDLQKAFTYLHRKVGFTISKEVVAKLFELTDESKNGMISYTAYLEIFNKNM